MRVTTSGDAANQGPVARANPLDALAYSSDVVLRAVLKTAPVMLITFGPDKAVTFCGGHPLPTGTGVAPGASTDLHDYLPDPDLDRQLDDVLAGHELARVLRFGGGQLVVDVRVTPVHDNGAVVGGIVVATDISAGAHAHEQLVKSEERFRSLVQRSSDIAMIFGPGTEMTYVSPSVRLFGYDPERLVGTSLVDYCHPDDAELAIDCFRRLVAGHGSTVTCELRLRDANGHYRWVEEVLTNHLDDPAIEGVVGNLRDITERKRAEQNLTRMALTDVLTGLPNRTEFTNRLRASIERSNGNGNRVTVVFLDLDQFKLINDSLGHLRGDDMLREVACRLRNLVRDGDVVGRFGGDEFVVLVEGGDDALPMQVAERLASAFETPIDIAEGTYFVSASIGVASTEPYDADAVLRNADTAMNRAKSLGRARIEFFDASLEKEAVSVLQMRNELRRAIDNEEFVLHFQPIMDLAGRRVDGMEALVRWHHPERGLVPPLDFIPAAEDSGLIVELGAWVLQKACHEAATWPEHMHIAVNLSMRQLADRGIVTVVAEALRDSTLDPHRLTLEITESALMANAEMAVGLLHDLKRLGVRLAIDDFGTGYSSLVYLKRMPVDAIKVDRSFVDGLGDDAEDTAIVSSVVSLAHAVGVQAIAEGVETAEQQAHLLALGCDLAQGYLWSRPVPSEDLIALIGRDTAQVAAAAAALLAAAGPAGVVDARMSTSDTIAVSPTV